MAKRVKERFDPQGKTGFQRGGRYWPLPVPFPDLDKEIEIPPGRPTFGTREEYIDWVKVTWINRYREQEVNRWIAEWAGLPSRCHRPACRRTRRCSDPAALCVYEHDAELSETHYPIFKDALRREKERRIAAGEDTSVPDLKTIIANFRAKHPKPR